MAYNGRDQASDKNNFFMRRPFVNSNRHLDLGKSRMSLMITNGFRG